jgi:hypothetical protein
VSPPDFDGEVQRQARDRLIATLQSAPPGRELIEFFLRDGHVGRIIATEVGETVVQSVTMDQGGENRLPGGGRGHVGQGEGSHCGVVAVRGAAGAEGADGGWRSALAAVSPRGENPFRAGPQLAPTARGASGRPAGASCRLNDGLAVRRLRSPPALKPEAPQAVSAAVGMLGPKLLGTAPLTWPSGTPNHVSCRRVPGTWCRARLSLIGGSLVKAPCGRLLQVS